MKIICTTSDKYLHLMPVFVYLFNKYWPGQKCEVVGYTKPNNLPDNFTFVSMGVQGHVSQWSTDLRGYFKQQTDNFIWVMEDTFFKSEVKPYQLPDMTDVGRCDLTGDIQHREFNVRNNGTVEASATSRYRLSTQPSVWSREYLLTHLLPNMDPWTFETQDPKNDGWDIIGFLHPPVNHNEGVRRFDPHKLNLDRMPHEDIDHIKTLCPWLK